jgi:hypothetical protein
MTIEATRVIMGACKWEFRFAMVEIDHAIQTIVTTDALVAHKLAVLGDEIRALSGVAIGTSAVTETKISIVAGPTIHRSGLVIHRMPGQAKTCGRVIERCKSKTCRVEVLTAVVRMATGTIRYVSNPLMHPLFIGDLRRYIRMALHTQYVLRGFKG